MAALRKKFADLDTRYKTGLVNTRTKVFITTHAAFGYLAERYGLTEEAMTGPGRSRSPARTA